MNKKGQFQPITIIMQVLLVLFFLASGFAGIINYWVINSIINNELTGIVAFLLAYMNLWILLGLMLVTSIGVSVWTGGMGE